MVASMTAGVVAGLADPHAAELAADGIATKAGADLGAGLGADNGAKARTKVGLEVTEVQVGTVTEADRGPARPALVPPLSFGCVDADVYRGSYPKPIFLPFLEHLELRTVVSITPEPLPAALVACLGSRPVAYIHVTGSAEQKKSKKKRDVPITHAHVQQVLAIVRDPRRRPVYVHCLNGRQATSLVVAALRVAQGWSLRSAFAEYANFCDYDRKDVAFVEEFARLTLHLDAGSAPDTPLPPE